MDKPVSNFNFRFMALCLKLRDLFLPREIILQEAQIEPGFVVLDFGCGPGSYSVLAAQMVGATGKIYALDIHPLAGQMVQKAAAKKIFYLEKLHYCMPISRGAIEFSK